MTDDDGIPAFLRLTPEARAAAWKANPPKAQSWHEETENKTTRELRQHLAAEKKAKTTERIARLKESLAAKQKTG